jgi:hypothetical protein
MSNVEKFGWIGVGVLVCLAVEFLLLWISGVGPP